MSGTKSLLATAVMMLALTVPALAQYGRWPSPLPPAPAWGDYDRGHAWHDAHGVPQGDRSTVVAKRTNYL